MSELSPLYILVRIRELSFAEQVISKGLSTFISRSTATN